MGIRIETKGRFRFARLEERIAPSVLGRVSLLVGSVNRNGLPPGLEIAGGNHAIAMNVDSPLAMQFARIGPLG